MISEQIDIYLPSIEAINQELAYLINNRVLEHLTNILRQLADDHQINFEKLKTQYLAPIAEVVHDVSKQ